MFCSFFYKTPYLMSLPKCLWDETCLAVTEFESSQATEKKRTVYQMALSKIHTTSKSYIKLTNELIVQPTIHILLSFICIYVIQYFSGWEPKRSLAWAPLFHIMKVDESLVNDMQKFIWMWVLFCVIIFFLLIEHLVTRNDFDCLENSIFKMLLLITFFVLQPR